MDQRLVTEVIPAVAAVAAMAAAIFSYLGVRQARRAQAQQVAGRDDPVDHPEAPDPAAPLRDLLAGEAEAAMGFFLA